MTASLRYQRHFSRGREPGCPGPPAQIPASGIPAPGSCRRSNAIEVRGLGGPCTSDPQAHRFECRPVPAQGPGPASRLALPSTGRLPSTVSAADLWSALFGASQVLCSRPTSRARSSPASAIRPSRRGPQARWPSVGYETSRFPSKERPCMLGSLTTPGRAAARDNAAVRVAFQFGNTVGTRDKTLSRLDGQPARSPTDASPWPSRDTTHGSGPVWLSGRGAGYPTPPPQIPACGFPAPGSCRKSSVIDVRDLGGPCSVDPRVGASGVMPDPALCPGHASASTTSSGRVPSLRALRRRSSRDCSGASTVIWTRPTPSAFLTGYAFKLPDQARGRACDCGRRKVSQVPTRSLRA